MIERLLSRAVQSRPTLAVIYAGLYAHNSFRRYRGERVGAVTTRRTQVPHGRMGTHRWTSHLNPFQLLKGPK